MLKIVKFYFNYNDYRENNKEIIEQLTCEGYDHWVSFTLTNDVVVYMFI